MATRTFHLKRAAAGAALIAVAACGGAEAPGGEESAVATWTVDPEPTVVIGEPGRGEAYDLYRVVGATRLSDGRIVVANGGTSELRWYGPDGTHLLSAAGEGDGPGEFRQMVRLLRVGGDTVVALGYRAGLAWFGPDGELARAVRVDASGVALPCRIREEWHALPDGTVLITMPEGPFHGEDCPASPEGRFRPPTLVAHLDPATGTFDTLGVYPGTERTGRTAAFASYGRDLALAVGPDRVVVGDTGAERILALGLGGDTLAGWSVPWDPTPLPPSARTERGPTRERDDGTVEVTRDYVYPESYPRFGRILLDREGHLWVMDYPAHDDPGLRSGRLMTPFGAEVEEGGARWRILAPDGRWIAEARTPPGLFPLEIGADYVLGVSRDELDVQRVTLHTLRPYLS